MRVVLDTNVVASALLWDGVPERLIELAGEGALDIVTSEVLLAELAGILERSRFAQKLGQKNLSAAEIVARYRELAETVEPVTVEQNILRDPDDEAVLACALAADADLIITGDHDLRVIESYKGIRIVSAAEAVRIITGANAP